LYTAATSKLSRRALNDAVYDFKMYFIINILVVAFSILAASLLSAESPGTRQAVTGKATARTRPGVSKVPAVPPAPPS
jgi:hypothetical protein